MTNRALHKLRDARTMDPVLAGEDLSEYHSSFDVMTNSHAIESRLSDSLTRGERIALIGATGSGKTSTTAFVIPSLGAQIAPFRIGVAIDDPLILGNPGKFAQHVVRRIAMTAEQMSQSTRTELRVGVADQHEVVRAKTRSVQAGLDAKIASISANLGTASQSINARTSAQEIIEILGSALTLVANTGPKPILIFDDTDTWIQTGQDDVDERRRSFFGDILRMLAGLGCGLLVAVHPQYLTTDEFRAANSGFLTTTVEVPRVPNIEGLRSVLELRSSGADVELDEAFESEAIVELHRKYEDKDLSLRAALRCASSAIVHAVEAGSELVGIEAIALGLREILSE